MAAANQRQLRHTNTHWETGGSLMTRLLPKSKRVMREALILTAIRRSYQLKLELYNNLSIHSQTVTLPGIDPGTFRIRGENLTTEPRRSQSRKVHYWLVQEGNTLGVLCEIRLL